MKGYLSNLIIALPFLFFCLFFGCHSDNKELSRYTFQHQSMGSMFNVVLYADDSLKAAGSVSSSFQELDQLNLILSDYIPHSEVMQLSRSSGGNEFWQMSDELSEVMEVSKQWYEWSGGVFDITIGPYTQLWRRAIRQDRLPDSEVIRQLKESVGFDLIMFDSVKGVLLSKGKMQLDFGGIAKGYAVDKIYKKLVEDGFGICLVDGAGDLRTGASPPDADGWRVMIQSFVGSDSTIMISNKAIATSGDFYRNLEIDGQRYSHIIDPFTGYGITASRSVTVMANDCTSADALASIFSITGPDRTDLNNSLPDGAVITIFEKEKGEVAVYKLP